MTDLRKMSLFRDVQVALDFQQMAAEGYVDTEFTMFGVAYYEDNARHYMVSANESRIIDFMEMAATRQLLTMPLQQLTDTCHVPLGERENIAHDVKLRLARDLQIYYPVEFMKRLQQFNAEEGQDHAKRLLSDICKKIANTFSSEKLTIVEALVNDAYRRKCLTTQSYLAFKHWFENEWENLSEDIIPKDSLSKTWYTLTYEDRPGHIKQLINARKEWVYNKKASLEKEGKLVAPVYSHTYWYNNQIALEDTREKHQALSKELIDEDYMQALLDIASYPPAFDQKAFEQAMSECEQNYGQKAKEALQYYGHLWRVS